MKQTQEIAQLSALLRRNACATALTKAGFPISPKTLASMVTRGGGPPYHKFGRAVLYRWSDVLAWAEGRLSSARNRSSDFIISKGGAR